ncbi:MAG: Fic family protein, partial [Calditrichaeota bacterium]|nr:Fic family protein [Calditrichota bacterium]
SEAKMELGRLDGIGRTLPDPELLLKPLQDREAMRSSSLEGTYATPQELFLFEMSPREPRSETDPANSWLEVSKYGKALREGMRLLEDLPFCLRLIRDMHRTLLSGVRGRERSPGEFRPTQVQIGSDRRFMPPPPTEMSACLSSLEEYMNADGYRLDPLVVCFVIHYQFETIHPFKDGNGRVGRVLLALMIHKLCGLQRPWLYMSAYFEKFKDEYIDSLFEVSTEGNWRNWIEFCLRGTIEQSKDSIRRCDLLGLEREKFHRLCQQSGARAYQIVDSLFVSPFLTIPEVSHRFSITYPTAKADIVKLEKLGILAPLPDTRPAMYYCPTVFRIAYMEA